MYRYEFSDLVWDPGTSPGFFEQFIVYGFIFLIFSFLLFCLFALLYHSWKDSSVEFKSKVKYSFFLLSSVFATVVVFFLNASETSNSELFSRNEPNSSQSGQSLGVEQEEKERQAITSESITESATSRDPSIKLSLGNMIEKSEFKICAKEGTDANPEIMIDVHKRVALSDQCVCRATHVKEYILFDPFYKILVDSVSKGASGISGPISDLLAEQMIRDARLYSKSMCS